ncbi:hypothetical protein SCP_0106300 [Sparassis crispa]|uniref:Guanine nucleotide-binding protein-like 1 n=1 Tax=Sparassis crispa TaxID=139825 RepID=A0A401G6F9_9APHY|nr:hypothetical protein SCP_0106300 [Sparassis crispa]GBE77748.1 hypothetical protein SCP_0106300 [Sparassis crispa]
MSKKEVEMNEEGLFKKWLAQTDDTINQWCNVGQQTQSDDFCEGPAEDSGTSAHGPPEPSMPQAPTSFERNLEVWRQLWRVTEISQILLILLDSRCPTLHYPPSLRAYLSSPPGLASRTRTILVLTKVDISGPAKADAWTRYLNSQYPGVIVVQVESYAEKNSESHHDSTSQRSRRAHEPHLPSAFRQTFVNALRDVHQELLSPPERIRGDPDRLRRWKPPVKRVVDWDNVLKAEGGQVGTVVGGPMIPRSKETEELQRTQGSEEDEGDSEPEFLTIGLLGQPNVGKSSLLNALFGTHKVKASKTPGKTKHFQTLFWTSDVRLVDCPGLVMPNFVPMEVQVLSGIPPISRISAIPLCIYHAAQLLPLEKIYGLTHPSLSASPAEDKRTWRDGMRPQAQSFSKGRETTWTAMDVLTAYALQKGWVTAKAGRPDVNRAGNAILRALAEGKIRWAFWPPGTDVHFMEEHQAEGCGIWMARPVSNAQESELDSDAGGGLSDEESGDECAVYEEEDVSDDETVVSEEEGLASGGWFGALALADEDASDDDSSDREQ